MKRPMGLVAPLIAIVFVAGCEQRPSQQSQQVVAAPVEKLKPDVSAVLANAIELREERVFLVTLKFQKEQITLDLWKHAKNAMAAESRTLIVGERTFNEYQIGQKVSSKGDGWGFVFNGELAEYVVRPTEKTIESQYFWVDRDGAQTELDKDRYDAALGQLKAEGRQLITVPFAGVVRTHILERPLANYEFVERQPLNRYFVTIRVQNSTLTLDLTKHIRNAANTHDITLEVPGAVYDSTGDAWNARLSTGSLIVKGHLSELRGTVIKKWTEVDDGYELVRTADNRSFIIPK